jgi:hypothetical protein
MDDEAHVHFPACKYVVACATSASCVSKKEIVSRRLIILPSLEIQGVTGLIDNQPAMSCE